MTKTEFLEIVEKYPNLTTHGFGVEVDPRMGLTYCQTFDLEREELRRSYAEFCYACDWMQSEGDLKPGRAACFWKVDLENYLNRMNDKPDHIPQGIVILAATALGYRIQRIRGSLGARIGKREEVKVS